MAAQTRVEAAFNNKMSTCLTLQGVTLEQQLVLCFLLLQNGLFKSARSETVQ